MAWTKQLFSFLLYLCAFYVTAPLPSPSYYATPFIIQLWLLSSHLHLTFAFSLTGNTLSGLSMPSYIMLGRKMELSILFPRCLCGLCGAFTKLIICRISQRTGKYLQPLPCTTNDSIQEHVLAFGTPYRKCFIK